MDMLGPYYGMDWICAVLSIAGMYMVGDKNRIGFVLNIIALILGTVIFMMAKTIPLTLLNIAIISLNVRAYKKWGTA
jgi:hypothetical protein